MAVLKRFELHQGQATLRRVRLLAAVTAVTAICVVTGCGGSDEGQVRAKVAELVNAVVKRDYTKICSDVLAPSVVTQLENVGVSCPHAMQLAFAGVEDPTIHITHVAISGDSATATAAVTLAGQAPSTGSISLIKTGQGWRLASPASPLTGGTIG